MDSNHRPHAYQACALTTWAMSPLVISVYLFPLSPLVEMMGFEPMTPCLQGRCSPNWATPPLFGVFYWVPFRSLKIEQQASHTRICTLLDLSSVVILLYLRLRNLINSVYRSHVLHRKEVIQPHLPIRLPCYDLTPIIEPTFDCCLLAVSTQASGVPNFHGLTGGVYKARERIHRDMLIRDY